MAGGVGIHLEGVGRVCVRCLLQHRRSEGHGEVMRRRWVVNPQVEMDLLRRAVGLVGRHMVRCPLDPDPRWEWARPKGRP